MAAPPGPNEINRVAELSQQSGNYVNVRQNLLTGTYRRPFGVVTLRPTVTTLERWKGNLPTLA